jgi:hypothetical protein
VLSGTGQAKIHKWGSRGTVRKASANWLLEQGRDVPLHEPDVRNTLIRPAGCCRYFDRVIADGEVQGRRNLVCESGGCAECWIKRVEAEIALITRAWPDDERYGVVKVTLPDVESLDRFGATVVHGIKNSPRVKLHGVTEDGRPTLTFIGTREQLAQTRGRLVSRCSERNAGIFAPGKADQVELEETLTATKAEAIEAVLQARLSIHFHHGGLIHAQNREGLLEWIEFLRPRRGTGRRGSRRLVTASKGSIGFPNREAIREFCRNGEVPVDLSDCWSVKFELHDAKHEWHLHTAEKPHSLPRAMAIAEHDRHYQAAKAHLDQPRDWAQERADAAYLKSRSEAPAVVLRL